MDTQRHVRLFRNGRNQAIRIPRELELDADEATIYRDGNRLIIEPVRRTRLLSLLATLGPLSDEFPDIDADLLPNDDIAL